MMEMSVKYDLEIRNALLKTAERYAEDNNYASVDQFINHAIREAMFRK